LCLHKLAPYASDIEVRSDGSISLERAEWTIGSFDLQAIEAGTRLAETQNGALVALSAGPQQINNSKLRKDLLSRGPGELVLVSDDRLNDADTAVTARCWPSREKNGRCRSGIDRGRLG